MLSALLTHATGAATTAVGSFWGMSMHEFFIIALATILFFLLNRQLGLVT